ncbi:unnamed protein product [Arctia plantaginis]|uniref:Uncharacterized protein n=1 Tax=Arctia plantaginis TaxID=874455 RepID=A0A8S1A973_ARCPL|nr:unnamed protein product [Arctia plantaginis]
MILDAVAHRLDDIENRRRLEARNQLETYVYQARRTITEHADKLTESEKEFMKQECQRTLEWLDMNTDCIEEEFQIKTTDCMRRWAQHFGCIELFKGGQHKQHAAMMVMAMLGFYFEVARHDRDKYIRVHMRHVRPGRRPRAVDQLEHTVKQLQTELGEREQELLLSDIEISNLPESPGENVFHSVELVAKKLGVTLEHRDIVFAERVGPRVARSRESGESAGAARCRRIVVRLARRGLREVNLDKLHHFEKIRDEATLDLPYDFKSATHPAWQFWRKIGKTGISTVATYKDKDPDGTIMRSLGQHHDLLSDSDIIKINSIYGLECFTENENRRAAGRKDET